MTACNATVTTATEELCPRDDPNDRWACFRPASSIVCNGEKHVTLHRTMTCKRSRACTDGQHRLWSDDWDGATPHVEPVAWVTDAEVAEAHALLPGSLPSEVRIALTAAAKTRQNTEGNTP
jgi:hypothetical protein